MRSGTASSLCGILTLRLLHSAASSLCGFLTLWLLHSAASLVYGVFHHPSAISFDHYIQCLPLLSSTPTSTLTSTTTSTLTSTSLTSHIQITHSHLPSFHLLLRQSVYLMAKFLDLPPEVRQIIYDELLVDPVNNESRLVCAWDASGNTTWSRGAEPLDTYVEPTVDNLPALIDLQSVTSTTAIFGHSPQPTNCSI